MKVKDLISLLQKCNQDKDVYLSFEEWRYHWTYGKADDFSDENNGVFIYACGYTTRSILFQILKNWKVLTKKNY
jgi:hypothetical protein